MSLSPLFAETFPAQAAVLRPLRATVVDVARRCGVADEELANVRTAVTEVATNAIVHGYGGGDADSEIRVEVFQPDHELIVVIADDGPGVAPRLDSPGFGLGLPVVAGVTLRFELRAGDGGGTEALLVFPCPAADHDLEQSG